MRPVTGFEAKGAPASAALAEFAGSLDESWRAGTSDVERFAKFRALSDETRSAWLGHLDHHASYIASWLKILKSAERAILTAAAKAEEAASLLLELGGHQSYGSEADIDLADAA